MCNNCFNNNCSGCTPCYPSVPNAWYRNQSCSPCAPISTCYPVSPFGIIPAPIVPNSTSLLYASFILDPVKLFAAPLQKYIVIPAPGPGYVIEPILTRLFLKVVVNPAVPVAYTDGFNPPTVNFNIGSNVIITDSTILGGIVDGTRFHTIPSTLFTSTFENLPLEVGTQILPIAGNSTLYIRILYSIVPL